METVILCGGKGTRLGPSGERDPKPLLEIGGSPILWHIMKIYAAQDHDRFVLCLGHLADRFREFAENLREPWRVALVDTGLDTPTGGRIKRVEAQIENDDFLVTYGDGVADVDLRRLVEFHRGHGRIATVTSVRPRTPFGVMHVDGDNRVVAFDEKPLMSDRVNGGFFVFRRDVFRYLADDSVLEREPFERLAADRELMAYSHDGFWACMDTHKDNLELNELWTGGGAPWKVWENA